MASQVRVVLLCCGSFNPITNMHLRMFELARDALHRTGKYRVVGGIISPVNDRYGKKDLAPVNHRQAMIKLALKTSDWIRLDPWESEQEEWQRTAVVLRHHKEQLDSVYNANPLPDTPTKKRKLDSDVQNPDEVDYSIPTSTLSNMNNLSNSDSLSGPIQLRLLCGADLLESFGTPGLWHDQDVEDICRHGIVCISRGGSDAERFIYESDVLTKYKNNITLVQEWISNEISSTRIRRAVRRCESVKYLVQDSVIEYIRQYGLYGCVDNAQSLISVEAMPQPVAYTHKYIAYPTPAQSRETVERPSVIYDDDNNSSLATNCDAANSLTPEVKFLSPGHYHRLDSEEISRSDYSSNESLTARSPRMTRRSVSCMGADITGLVRRVKNMRVALTPETCV